MKKSRQQNQEQTNRLPRIQRQWADLKRLIGFHVLLIFHLARSNGWWRDTAQKLLVLRNDTFVLPAHEELKAFRNISL